MAEQPATLVITDQGSDPLPSHAMEDGVIGRIERLELRKVWKHEALNFTTWLAENIDVLNDATGLQLVGVEREKSAGSFNVDIVGETDGGRVVVENQLEKSDHDHLGKLLTYLVVMDATRAIWIVADPRPEHVAVVTWLNESASADFHLLKLEAIQIGDSAPAALLTQIVGPSEELKAVGTEKKQLAERQRLRYQFWEGLLNYARLETKLHANISPSTYNWVATGAGIAGVSYNYCVLASSARIELYIGNDKKLFETLLADREGIEAKLGYSLEWQEMGKGCRISRSYDVAGYRDDDYGRAVYKPLVAGMIRLESIFKPYLKKAAKSRN